MDDFVKQLAGRLRTYDSETIAADEMNNWPEGNLHELLSKGILTEIEPAGGLVCDQCEENCYIEPDRRTIPNTGETIGIFVCTRNPGIGRFEVDLNRLRQWRINKKKLWKLVYRFNSEWQMPWDDDNAEYVLLQEAVNLANSDSITLKSMSRLLEDANFPVHHMHKGRRCKIHLGEFRRWLKFAQHGRVTDKSIEKYLKGVRERKEQAQRKKRKRSEP
ncbi:MAG: hypothetical protein P8Z79_24445 [Sedimentisphaerales bacterium]|jgi:hypothetical protein